MPPSLVLRHDNSAPSVPSRPTVAARSARLVSGRDRFGSITVTTAGCSSVGGATHATFRSPSMPGNTGPDSPPSTSMRARGQWSWTSTCSTLAPNRRPVPLTQSPSTSPTAAATAGSTQPARSTATSRLSNSQRSSESTHKQLEISQADAITAGNSARRSAARGSSSTRTYLHFSLAGGVAR